MNDPAGRSVSLLPITEADFPVVRDLATDIWRRHYTGIISAAQIDFMLARRFADESLRAYLGVADRWLEVLRVSGTPVGYCSSELIADAPAELKLGQLYVRESSRGTGLGAFMLAHVEARAREHGRDVVVLQVNTQNRQAIAFYEAAGFTVRHAAVFDIGEGFVMDDFVMAKTLMAGRQEP
jgi:ribosomal protein S18 acetylase RimI-like enzyme